MAVMEQESTYQGVSCNPNAYNPEWHYDINGKPYCQGSFGLMQISCHSGQLYNPEQNIAAAWEKYKARGWQPWGAYTSGKYLKYLR